MGRKNPSFFIRVPSEGAHTYLFLLEIVVGDVAVHQICHFFLEPSPTMWGAVSESSWALLTFIAKTAQYLTRER